MTSREEISSAIQKLLGVEPEWSTDGSPRLEKSILRELKWPKNISPLSTVVMDTLPGPKGESWPEPRFEILIANLDSVGLKSVQCGGSSETKLGRALHDFSKLSSPDRAAVISGACMWIGMESPWRWIAAALDTPQVVITGLSDSTLIWKDTFVVRQGKHAAESSALGPISVTDVAEAATLAMKFAMKKASR
ncbi:hypothetical protein IT157_03895 [bacterium]|nr:hypothetical protein [bacterium]